MRVIEARRRVEKARAWIENEGGEGDVRLVLTFTDQSGTVRRRTLDGGDDGAEAALDEALSSSAIYDEYLDAIEERAAVLRGDDGAP